MNWRIKFMPWEDEDSNSINRYYPIKSGQIRLSQYMWDLIDKTQSEALKKQFIPHNRISKHTFFDDYLREEDYTPIPHLIHRYKNKALIIATNQCACYCQFCTRQRITQKGELSLDNLMKITHYIKIHPEINDVLITGGDPLTLKTSRLITILEEIEKIENVKILRIGTRIPITLPQRIDSKLIKALSGFTNLYINIHINHPDELTEDSKKAILSLANVGIPLGSQSVFLKGVNDDISTLKRLFEELVTIKVKPYYLYQCDKVKGCEEFIADARKGIDIINRLCNQISGFALPKFVVDTPELGKMVLAPCSVDRIDHNLIYLSNGNDRCIYDNPE